MYCICDKGFLFLFLACKHLVINTILQCFHHLCQSLCSRITFGKLGCSDLYVCFVTRRQKNNIIVKEVHFVFCSVWKLLWKEGWEHQVLFSSGSLCLLLPWHFGFFHASGWCSPKEKESLVLLFWDRVQHYCYGIILLNSAIRNED